MVLYILIGFDILHDGFIEAFKGFIIAVTSNWNVVFAGVHIM